MSTIVLVHGAWHGGWCWKALVPYLQAEGHKVYTPTLTGLGERSHLLSSSIDISCHIQDVVNVLFYQDLQDVTLVGHSYGGAVISGVAEKCPNRLSQLVYLDAIVPQDGKTINDLLVSTSNEPIKSVSQAPTLTPETSEPIPSPPPAVFGVIDPASTEWMQSRLTPHPEGTLSEPLSLTSLDAENIPRYFISCVINQDVYMRTIAKIAKRIQNDVGWQYSELETGHNPMMTAPKELGGLLNNIVGQ